MYVTKISILLSVLMVLSSLGTYEINAEAGCEQRDKDYNFAEKLLDDDSRDKQTRLYEALSIYEKLNRCFGDDFPNAIGGIASVHHRLENTDLALEYYSHGISVDPDNPYFRADLGLLYHGLGDIKKAEEEFSIALTLNPHHYNALNGLADLLNSKGQFSQALKFRNAALLSDDKQIDAVIGKGNDFQGLGKFDMAIINYLQALNMKQDNSNALVGLGNVYFEMNQFGLSIWHYDQALIANENHKNAIKGKFGIFHCVENYEKAEELKIKLEKLSVHTTSLLKIKCPNHQNNLANKSM